MPSALSSKRRTRLPKASETSMSRSSPSIRHSAEYQADLSPCAWSMIPPLAVHVASTSPHEPTLVGPTIERRFLAETPEWLIGDPAYRTDPLAVQMRARLRQQ